MSAALALLLSAPLLAAAPEGAAPAPGMALADFLTATVGEEGLEALGARGYLALQGPKGARRVAAAHWKALERLAAASKSCWSLAAAVDAAVSTGTARNGDFRPCRALPPGGLATPAVRAMAAALAALREESAALAADGAAPPDPGPEANLFAKPWGRELSAAADAELLEDPSPLLRSFFEEKLAGPRPVPEAVEHFVAEGASRGAVGLGARLEADALRGSLSDELRAQLRRYLVNERRRWNALAARAELARLRKAAGRELDELALVAAPLAEHPGVLERAEASSAGRAVAAVPRLRSAGLHLQEPTRLGQHELGDEIVFSGAYWVDGLPEGKSVELEETTFAESADGFFALESRRVRRANGGPYPYARRLRVEHPGPFVARAVISAASGGALSERAEVRVAPDFELALKAEAAAAGRRLACDPDAAEDEYAKLEELVAEPAKAKPQYKALAARARAGREASAKDAARLAGLDELLARARAAASPQSCRYSPADAEAGLKLLDGLPAGCDQARPEFARLRALAARRAAEQSWFLKASAQARSRRRSCDLEGAARRWTEALAALETDPALRCGKAAEEAALASRELAELRRELAWGAEFARALDQAESRVLPRQKLEGARPVLARLPALPSARCLSAAASRAESIAREAGAALGPAGEDELARRLPADSTLAAVSADVRRERARLSAAAENAARARAQAQSPESAAPEVSSAPPAPEAAVEEAKPAPRRARRTGRKAAPWRKAELAKESAR